VESARREVRARRKIKAAGNVERTRSPSADVEEYRMDLQKTALISVDHLSAMRRSMPVEMPQGAMIGIKT